MAVRNECSATLSVSVMPASHYPERLTRLSWPIAYRYLAMEFMNMVLHLAIVVIVSARADQRPVGVWVRVRLSCDDASQVRSDRVAQLSSGRRPTQVRCSYLSRCQYLLNGSQKRRSCLLFAEMVEQELP
jgi:hypothetical protein